MSPRERVECVLAGRQPDRPPVSFWHHFGPECIAGPAAVEAHLQHVEAFGLDFLKVMNDNDYPHSGRVESVADLASLTVLRGDEPRFARQLELIATLKRKLEGRLPLVTTVFNVWATLRHLIRPPTSHNPPTLEAADPPSDRIKQFWAQDPERLKQALGVIATSLANFVRRCLDAGADGIFLSVRDDWLQSPEMPTLYHELVRPGDLEILGAAAGGWFNILHVCGKPADFEAFAGYPVQAINWADRAAGPSLAQVCGRLKPAICGGIDNLSTLVEGTPEDCEREVADALRQVGDRPILITPGCTYDPARVPRSNLEAVCGAVRR